MKLLKSFVFSLLLLCASCSFADEVIWSGEVRSDGTPTQPITLTLRENYQIRASGFINLGKWIQASEKLANDSCFEFNKEKELQKIECLKNSQNVSVCDGTYRPDHVYQSQPFTAKQNRIHFWVYDTDYDDNHGSFKVEIIHKSAQ